MITSLNLTPAVLNIDVYAGDTEEFQVYFVTSEDVAIDVSEYTWSAQIREYRTSTDFNAIEVNADNANLGVLLVSVPASVTENLPQNSVWDLQGVYSGNPTTFLQGKVTCTKDVTR